MDQLVVQQPQEAAIGSVESWLQLHGASLITCHRLPGAPRISREACLRRHQMAVTIKNRSKNESLFDGGGPVGLDICLDCPTHRELAKKAG